MTFKALSCLFSAAAFLAHAVAEITAPLATLTTLPPALPTSNNTDPCAFTDRVSLLDRVESDWQDYNISMLVTVCSQVCPLVYGTGNPDISGIGVSPMFLTARLESLIKMIGHDSYIIQGILILLFGPVFAMTVFIFKINLATPGNQPFRIVRVIGNILPTVYSETIFLSLSVFVASIIRIKGVPPIAELDFIKLLAVYQYCITVGTVLSQSYVFPKRVKVHLYSGLITAFMIIVQFMNRLPSQKAKLLKQITDYCSTELDFSLPLVNFKSAENSLRYGIFVLSYSAGLVGLSVVIWLLWKYFSAVLSRLGRFLWRKYVEFCSFLGVAPARFHVLLCGPLFTVYWASSCIALAVSLQDQRHDLQKSVGSNYQDSEWGFGQITAMLIWGPLIQDIILGALGKAVAPYCL